MKNQKRIFKIAGIVIAVIVLFLLAGSFLFTYFAKQKIREAKLGSFELKTKNIETSLFQRQIKLLDTELTKENSHTRMKIPSATISGIKFLHLLFGNELVVKKFRVDGPTIFLHQTTNNADSTSNEDSSSKSRIIKIKELEIPGVQFYFIKRQQGKTDTIYSSLFNINASNITTDSSTTGYNFSGPGFQFDRIGVMAEKGEFKMGKGLYKFGFENLSFDSDNSNLVVDHANLVSPYGKYEIGQHTGVETDWYDLHIDSIEVKDINLKTLLQDTVLKLKTIYIKNVQANIFRDKRLPFPEKPDTKLPAEMVQSIPVGFHSDSVILRNADIQYEEHGKNAEEAGKVTFNNLFAKFTDLGNIDSLRNGPVQLSASAEVMNAATLNVDFSFTMSESSQPSQVTGSLEPAEFAIFNPMLQPYVGVKVQSGRINRLDFNFGYNNSRSTGDMIFEYNDLDFIMLNQESNSKKLVITFLANTLVIEEQNQQGNSSYEKGEIDFERHPKKSVFSYWWKSLLSGLKSIATTV